MTIALGQVRFQRRLRAIDLFARQVKSSRRLVQDRRQPSIRVHAGRHAPRRLEQANPRIPEPGRGGDGRRRLLCLWRPEKAKRGAAAGGRCVVQVAGHRLRLSCGRRLLGLGMAEEGGEHGRAGLRPAGAAAGRRGPAAMEGDGVCRAVAAQSRELGRVLRNGRSIDLGRPKSRSDGAVGHETWAPRRHGEEELRQVKL